MKTNNTDASNTGIYDSMSRYHQYYEQNTTILSGTKIRMAEYYIVIRDKDYKDRISHCNKETKFYKIGCHIVIARKDMKRAEINKLYRQH
jgi:hypothetical protein